MTIAELITYIQEQRVLCNCCAAPSEQAASVTWGYDDSTLNDVLIIANADGSISYESPIGSTYTPTGAILPIQRKVRNFTTLNSILATGAGSTSIGAHRIIFTWDSGTTPTINGVVQWANNMKIFDAVVLGDGQYVGLPSITYDGAAGNLVIDELIL